MHYKPTGTSIMYDQDQRNFAYASGTAGPALIILVIFFFVIIGVIYVA